MHGRSIPEAILLEELGIPVHQTIIKAVRALKALRHYAAVLKKREMQNVKRSISNQ
jgi:acyl-CoA synthetase (NDP forming)